MHFKPISSTDIYSKSSTVLHPPRCFELNTIVLPLSMWEIHQSITWPKKFFKCFSHIVSGSDSLLNPLDTLDPLGWDFPLWPKCTRNNLFNYRPRPRSVYAFTLPLSGKSFECALRCLPCCLSSPSLSRSLSVARVFFGHFLPLLSSFLRCFFCVFFIYPFVSFVTACKALHKIVSSSLAAKWRSLPFSPIPPTCATSLPFHLRVFNKLSNGLLTPAGDFNWSIDCAQIFVYLESRDN